MPSKKPTTKKTTATKSTTVKAPAAKKQAAKKAAPQAPVATAASMAPIESAAAAHQETMETVMKAGNQAATKSYEQVIAIAQEQVEKASQSIFKRYDEAASLSQENVDACVLCGTVFAQGVESMGKELMSFAQSAVEANVATTKALFGATTLRELIDLQTEFQRSRFDSLIAESAKLTELSMALANDTLEPIQVRLNANVEKLLNPIAA
jgi:phasin family protein